MGMCIENFDLQWDSLSATGPLYANTAKSNYTTAIAYFFTTIEAYPELKERLHYCDAFKIPYDIDENPESIRHVCFGFDETLKTFGMKYIKQNISENVIDEKNLKNQIKSSQSERDRIDLLISEYLNDYSTSYSKRAIDSYQESLWNLINELVVIFGMDDPLSHQLFQEYMLTQMYQEGLDCLIACYPNRLEWIKGVYRQEVLKIEHKNS